MKTKSNTSEDESSINTATVFSSRFFPPSNIHPASNTDTSNDDNISILTCLEQEYDFKEINKKELVNIPQDTNLSQKANAKDISKIYNAIKHKNACTPEPSVEDKSNKEYIKEKNRCLKTHIYIYKTDV